ncbi:hypothetical protein BDF19DRAFT_147540 [Syncephalis fuscata]|nr:hypothetical protein BDF19DRAFT_147540 [Syncephalis fuscata]
MASLDSTNSLILSTNEIKAATINIPQVPGLVLVTEYITMEEEKQLLEEFTYDSHTMTDQWDRVQDRFVQHYGHIFDYTTNRVQDAQHPIPKSIEQLLDRLPDYWPRPDQLTVSNYPSGAGIPPHVDSHQAFDDTVYSFSLGHPIMMELRPAIDVKSTTTTTLAVDRPTFVVDLPPRSLLVMRNDARYLWEHSIRARHSDLMPNGQLRARQLRVSFTMRPINRRGRCQCPWPDICQLRNKGLPARDE